MFKKILYLLIPLCLFSISSVSATNIREEFIEEEILEIDIGEMEEQGYFIDDVEDVLEFIELSNTIESSSSTIIPNQLVAESVDGSLKQVSAKVVINAERLNALSGNSNPIKLVIGDVKAVTEKEYEELCRIVQSEAGNQDIIGKVLIANVIFNRIESYRFEADNVHDVIFASGQFSPVSNGTYFTCKISDETREAVKQALNGVDYSNGATFFMARRASNRLAVTWFDTSLTYLFKHGGHEFFK